MSKIVLIRDESGEEQPYEVENGVSLQLNDGIHRQFFYLPADGTVPITDTSLTNVGLYEYAQVQDVNLVSGNIKSGSTILGVPGDSNVVDTSNGNATADDIKVGKVAYVQGEEITGTGTGGGGPGWLPTSPDYTSEYAYLNRYAESSWDALLPELTYTLNEDGMYSCVIAKCYTGENVESDNQGQLIAYDFTSTGGSYCVGYFYLVTIEGEEVRRLDKVYSMAQMTTTIIPEGKSQNWDIGWDEMYHGSGIAIDTDFTVNLTGTDTLGADSDEPVIGSLVPIINEPISGTKVGWDNLWSGSYISFGMFDEASDISKAISIIRGTVTTLDYLDIYRYINTNPIRECLFKNAPLVTLELWGGISIVGNSAFYGCTDLTEVTMHRHMALTVTSSVGEQAFYGCTSLKLVDLISSHASITTVPTSYLDDIGDYAFYGCTSLERVVLGAGYSSLHIGDYAFDNCPNLKEMVWNIRYSDPSYTTIGTDAIDTTSLQVICVPEDSVSSYKSAFPQYASYIVALGGIDEGSYQMMGNPGSYTLELPYLKFTAKTTGGEERSYVGFEFNTISGTVDTGIYSTWNGTRVQLATYDGTLLHTTSLMDEGIITLADGYLTSKTNVEGYGFYRAFDPVTYLPAGEYTFQYPTLSDYSELMNVYLDYFGSLPSEDISFEATGGTTITGVALMGSYDSSSSEGYLFLAKEDSSIYNFAELSSSQVWTCDAVDDILTISSSSWQNASCVEGFYKFFTLKSLL